MKFKLTMAIVVVALSLFSCGTSEKKVMENGANTVEEKISNVDYQEQGFLKGIVRSGNEAGSCDYVVEILGGIVVQKVDPIDMPESLKKDSQLVWIKFGASRRVSRCPEAKPVIIKDIKERAK